MTTTEKKKIKKLGLRGKAWECGDVKISRADVEGRRFLDSPGETKTVEHVVTVGAERKEYAGAIPCGDLPPGIEAAARRSKCLDPFSKRHVPSFEFIEE